jgi:predicted ATPase/DNA-binding CsgD family transcriptional regulator/DNA-binding XRE family transcriptional regulator
MMRDISGRHSIVFCMGHGGEWKEIGWMTTPRTPALAELLRQYRIAAGLTQEELAECARISVRAISDLERGVRRAPHKDTLCLLAEALGLSEDDRALLFEAVHETRRADAAVPAPSTHSAAPPKSFPVPLTPLIGREREEAAIAHLLLQDEVRLLTLTGPAGIGKTRLATQTALDHCNCFANVVFVSLAAVTEPALVLPAIGQALGLREQAGQPVMDQLSEYLSWHDLLLALDNFEQVVQAGPDIAQLLATCPRVKALITSRVALRVRGEHEFPVPPLETPDLGCLPGLEDLSRYAAVTLFVQRARAVNPTFALTSALAPTIAAICARLDGIPLALELAAARIKLLTPKALLARLDGSLALLTHGATDLPERQQTMRRAIAWSYDLLDESEQRLFRSLAVFVDGWTLEAAEAICGESDDEATDVLDGLTTFVNSSLVVQEARAGGEPRFRLLELMREYGWEQLVAQDDISALRSRHALYYCTLAVRAEPELHGGSQRAWLACLAQEHPNLRAALGWARETHSAECGLRLGGALWWFWQLQGHAREGRTWLEDFLSFQQNVVSVSDKTLRANALKGAGNLAWVQGEHEAATALLAESLDLYRAHMSTNLPGIAHVLITQGMIADERGDYPGAVALYEESLALWREVGDVTMIGAVLTNLAIVEARQERYAQAILLFEESLALHRAAQDHHSIALTLCNLGEAKSMEGDLATATQLLEEGLEAHRALGDKGVMADPLLTLAGVAREQGDLERAATLTYEALTIASEVGPQFAVCDALESMAEIAYSHGRSALATQVFALATILRETHHIPQQSSHAKLLCATRIDALRATLGDQAFTTAWEQGQKRSLDEAIQRMSALLSAPKTETARQNGPTSGRTGPRPRTRANSQGLTNRELEVLPLLAEGLQNVDIADRLSTSRRIVEHHVSGMLMKFNARSRTEAVQRAYELGLLPLVASDPAPK